MQKKIALLLCRQSYYEQGEAAGRFLVQRVKQYNHTLITFVEDENGSLVTDTVEINNGFRGFYQKLYTLQCTTDQDDIDNFFVPGTSAHPVQGKTKGDWG